MLEILQARQREINNRLLGIYAELGTMEIRKQSLLDQKNELVGHLNEINDIIKQLELEETQEKAK